MASNASVTVTVSDHHPLVDRIEELMHEIIRLRRYEEAIQRMAAQYIHPKITAEEMVESILKAEKL